MAKETTAAHPSGKKYEVCRTMTNHSEGQVVTQAQLNVDDDRLKYLLERGSIKPYNPTSPAASGPKSKSADEEEPEREE
jgi:hypothetical protein